MKDHSQMMNQSQMMSMGQPMPVMNQSQQVMNNQNSQMLINPPHMMVNQSQSPAMLNHRGRGGYGMWPPPQVDPLKFKNPNTNHSGFVRSSSKPLGPRNNKNWKGKKGNNNNWKELPGYNPPTLNELQQQNRLKARRYFSKKKFNHGGKSAPFAPRNTTSFLIRAKKAGGITSLVSPCPVTPAVLPTPIFSPSREVLVDMAKEEWGVDGYGSMKGLIRLRSPGNEDDEESGSSESDVEEHVEVERRLDHDLSRFEMIYPNCNVPDHSSYLLENRVDDQDTHIAQLEEENLTLKERLFLMEREFDDLRMRLQCLERQSRGAQGFVEEVVENNNDSENESESHGYGRSVEENNEVMQEHNEGNQCSELKESTNIEKGTAIESKCSELKESNNNEKGTAIETNDEVLKDVCVEKLRMEDNIMRNDKEHKNV